MKKGALRLLTLSLLMIQLSCGGGDGSSSSSGSYRTTVHINLGQTRTASAESGTILKESSQIPAAVASIRFTISAPDMATIQRVVAVAGRTAITESFDVPTGNNRLFVVEALDSVGNVIFRGERLANVGQQPLTLTITTVNTDPVSPDFAGLTNITEIGTTSVVLNWSPASDNITPQDQIQYVYYMSTAPAGIDYSAPKSIPQAGAISHTVSGLASSTTYHFVVRAKDELGNADANENKMSATTLADVDRIPPDFGGVSSAVPNLQLLAIDLSWSTATDNVTSPADIVYRIYMSTQKGAEDYSSTPLTTQGVTTFRVNNVSRGTAYFFVVRAVDAAGNEDANTTEITTFLTPPNTPPNFQGLSSAVPNVPLSAVDLSWSPAQDDVSSPANIVYLIYMSTEKGGEKYYVTTEAGATSYRVPNLPLGTTYFFVVRAKDEAENIDSNNVERSADLSFTDLSVANVNPSEGYSYLNFDLVNTGNLAVGKVEIFVLRQGNYNQYCKSLTDSVPAKGSALISEVFLGGSDIFKIIADPNNRLPSEYDRNNNTYCSNVESSLCLGPTPASCTSFTDLSIANVTDIGDGCYTFDVQNSGDLAANKVDVFVVYEDSYNYQYCESQVIPAVPGDSSVPASTICFGGANSYKIIVDPNNLLPLESNRTNNTYCSNSGDPLCTDNPPTTCLGPR